MVFDCQFVSLFKNYILVFYLLESQVEGVFGDICPSLAFLDYGFDQLTYAHVAWPEVRLQLRENEIVEDINLKSSDSREMHDLLGDLIEVFVLKLKLARELMIIGRHLIF